MAGKTYREEPGNGGVWHVYSDGRRVWVPTSPATTTWRTPNASGKTGLQQLAEAWAAKGNAPTQQMIDQGLAPAPAAAPAGPAQIAPDAQYFADQAAAEFARNQERQQLDAQESSDKSAYAEALRRMSGQRPVDEQNARQGANRQGLLFSGHLGKALGDIGTDYTRRQADAQGAFSDRQAARDAARRALEGGASVDEAAALAAAADRQLQRDTTAADAGYLAPVPAAPAVAQATAPKGIVQQKKAVTTTGYNKKRKQRYQTVSYGGKTYHVYAGGKAIPLRPRAHI